MLDLRRLHVFREVCRHRSFSAAAAALDYTQSSVSQQISTLEAEVGATLLDRASRPVRPTPSGELLLVRAEALLDHAAAIEHELGELGRGDTGLLRVVGFYTAWATFLPTAVGEFSRARPAVALEMQQLEPGPARRAVLVGDADVAVLYGFEDPEEDDRLRWTRLGDDRYAVALPAGHRLAAGPAAVQIADLAAERWVCPPPDTTYTQVLMRLCREHGGFEPVVRYETEDIAMAQPLVAAGLAVALLPALALLPRHAGVEVRPVAGTPPARSLWAVTRARGAGHGARALIAALVEAAQASARTCAPPGSRRT